MTTASNTEGGGQQEPYFGGPGQTVSNYAGGEMSGGPPSGSPISLASLNSGQSPGFTQNAGGGANNNLISSVPIGGDQGSGSPSYSAPSDRGSFMPTNNTLTASLNPGAQQSPAALASFNQGLQSGSINSGNIGNIITAMSAQRMMQPPQLPPTSTA
jgi:hypothetical protein